MRITLWGYQALPLLVAMAGLSLPASAATILFQDTFDRDTTTATGDLDASTTGMTAAFPLMAQGVYLPDVNGLVQNNRVSKQTNLSGMAYGIVNHSFTDADLLASGEFTVSLDVISLTTSGNATGFDPIDRFVGYGVGYSATEVATVGDVQNPNGVRNGHTNAGVVNQQGVGDIFVEYGTPAGVVGSPYAGPPVIRVHLGRSLDTRAEFTTDSLGNPIAYGGTLATRFWFASLGNDETMNYEVTLNGIAVTSGNYAMSNGDNYIGYGARASNDFEADNFTISTLTIPEPSSLALVGLLVGLAAWSRRK